jgi:hypothetical protein
MENVKWKSSRSGNGGNSCVELARLPHSIGLRDSKNPAAGNLTLSPAGFADLVARVKRGELSI